MKQLFFIAAILLSGFGLHAQTDSTVTVSSGVALVVHRTDSTADSVRFNSFVPIVAKEIIGAPNPAVVMTVSMEEGDFSSYIVVRYNLVDSTGNIIYTDRYRIAGSSYAYFNTHGVAYAYWKILEDPAVRIDYLSPTLSEGEGGSE